MHPDQRRATTGRTTTERPRTRERGRGRRPLAVTALAALAVVAAACAPPPGGAPGPGDTTTTTEAPSSEPFTVVFVADSETRMRGNTNAEIAGYVSELVALRSTREEYFAHDGGAHRVDPELVILGGDISADRQTSIEADLPLWAPLYANGIAFVAAAGNHDWEPENFGDDGPGYSVSGHLSNESTKAFVRETYVRSAALSDRFSYRAVAPSSVHGPVNYVADYRGVDIVNFNTFLYQPSYRYPDGWPFSCNLLLGGAGCQVFVSAEPQIERVEQLLPAERSGTALFVQHYPISTTPNWWGDSGASGTTITQKNQRLLSLMDRYDDAVLLAGHNHVAASRQLSFEGRLFEEHVAPYFGGSNGDDPSFGGGALAVLVSPTEGVLEVRVLT